jgi:PAS domain S-box-containing protein
MRDGNQGTTGMEPRTVDETEKPRLLVVDDDRDFAESLAEVLASLGYDVVTAYDHASALACAKRHRPDVAIVDVKLGHASGVDLLNPLRADCPDVQCIMMTGFAAIESIIESFRREAVDYLYKPADLESLKATVERCIRTARLRREKGEAVDALRRSEERYRQLADATMEAVVIHDGDTILEANAAFGTLFGGPPATFTGHQMSHLWSVDSVTAYAELVAANDRATAELVGKARDGTAFPATVRVASLPEAGPAVHVTVVSDLTAQRRAEDKQRHAEAQMRQSQKMEAIGLLTGGIAHDFNNVLQGIIGFANLASRSIREGRTASLGAFVHEIESEASRARDLIAQLLLYSRGGTVQASLIQADAVVAQTLSLLRSALSRRIQLTTHLNQRVMVLANATQLQQVVMNLCINARDALPETCGAIIDVTVEVLDNVEGICASCGVDVSGRFVAISVTDNGSGIPDNVALRIFDPFFSTKEVGKGSGMGLAVAHGVAHEHGGHFLLTSRPGFTRFQLVLPTVAVEEERTLTSEAPPTTTFRPAKNIMVVDDEPTVADYLAALFTDVGFHVTTFSDPRAALAEFYATPAAWDLVITDQMMPGMAGERMAKLMLEQRPDLPIVLCSGYAEDTGPERASALGIGAFLEKPYDADLAVDTVRALLRGAKGQRAP